MIRALAIGLLAATAVSSAMAADLIVEEPVYEAAVEAAGDWSGPYIGVKGGWATGTSNFDFTTAGTEVDIPIDGWTLGAVAGAGFQMDAFYLGVEGEVSWTDVGGSDSCVNPAFDCFVDSKWLADIEAQVGVAAGPALLYVHGGFAAVNQDVGEDDLVLVGDTLANDTAFGWVAGAGVKLNVAENVDLVGEYSYYDVQSTFPIGTVDILSETVLTSTFHTVSVGLNLSF